MQTAFFPGPKGPSAEGGISRAADARSSLRPLNGRVAFYGRTLDDYAAVFGLDRTRMRGRSVLDVAAGPSSFTVEATLEGARAVAVDPLYRLGLRGLQDRFERDFAAVRQWVEAHPATYERTLEAGGPGSIAERRRAATRRFLGDYRAGVAAGRYHAAALPQVPFATASFDVVLCGHFLFLYAHVLGLEFQVEACRELVRLAREEVRLYPLVGFDGRPVAAVEAVRRALAHEGVDSALETLESPMLRGANERLILRRA